MPPNEISQPVHRTPSLRPVGIMVLAALVLALAAIVLHPAGHGRDPAAVIASIAHEGPRDRLVHGSLLAAYVLIEAAMLLFSRRLGFWRLPVLLAVVAFSSAMNLIVLAGLIDGFIAPALAEGCAPASAACAGQAADLLRFGAVLVDYLTRFGFAAIGISVICWGGALLSTRGAPRWAGAAGLAAGLLQLGALLAIHGRLTAHSLAPLMAGQFAWYAIVAAVMARGRGRFGDEAKLRPIDTTSDSSL